MLEALDYKISQFCHGNIASHFAKRKYLFSTDMRYEPKMFQKVVTVGWYRNVVGFKGVIELG
jgi:hypothetical protein